MIPTELQWEPGVILHLGRNPGIAGSRGGSATSDVIISAHLGGNSDVFPEILDLHVPDGSASPT